MIITLEHALPCAQVERRQPQAREHDLCGQPAHIGVITPGDEGLWELFPVYQQHFQEAVHDCGESDTQRVKHLIRAHAPTEQGTG